MLGDRNAKKITKKQKPKKAKGRQRAEDRGEEMRPMQALFFAGPMLADGVNSAGETVTIDGVTDFHLHDKFSCRVGQEGRGAPCSQGVGVSVSVLFCACAASCYETKSGEDHMFSNT